MSLELSDEEGAFLVRFARRTIESYLRTGRKPPIPPDIDPKFTRKSGVFVTLSSIATGAKELRGCIGYPEPIYPLIDAVRDSAISSAVDDPRFPPVTAEELDEIVVEVSVLTPSQLIEVKDPLEYPQKIRIGEDGLIIERGWNRGLLLPQVAIEWNWNEEEFLSQCCIKAGLPPDSWLMPGTKISKFQAIIFEEESPNGNVRRMRLR